MTKTCIEGQSCGISRRLAGCPLHIFSSQLIAHPILQAACDWLCKREFGFVCFVNYVQNDFPYHRKANIGQNIIHICTYIEQESERLLVNKTLSTVLDD